MRFYNYIDYSDQYIAYMFSEEGIIMVIYRKNLPLMKNNKNCF